MFIEIFKLLSNRKLYQISKEHKFRDSAELLFIFILLISIIIPPFLVVFLVSNQSCPVEVSRTAKIALANLNEMFALHYEKEEKSPQTLDEFTDIMQKRLHCASVYNVKNIKDGQIYRIDKQFIKKNKKHKNEKNKIDEEFAKLPCIYTLNGVMYFVNSYKNGCKNFNLKNPENSDCWLTVDANSFKSPNKLAKLHEKYLIDGDRVIIVIMPTNEQKLVAVLPEKYDTGK